MVVMSTLHLQAGSWISGACLDFAPACEAALKILCDICSSHCDVPTVSH